MYLTRHIDGAQGKAKKAVENAAGSINCLEGGTLKDKLEGKKKDE